MSKSKQHAQRLQSAAELAAGRGYRLAFSLVGNRHDAEELVSRALTIATAKEAEIPRKVWPWLAKVITFEARNMRRRSARRGAHDLLDESEHPDSESATPLEAALKQELNERLWLAFRKLDAEEREALALTTLGGLSKREAAKELGISATSLRRKIDGALAKLQSELGVSKKLLLGALPLLGVAASSSFIAGLGSTLGLKAGVKVAAGSSILVSSGTLAGGLLMKKIVVSSIILLLLLLGGWGAFELLDEGEASRGSEALQERREEPAIRASAETGRRDHPRKLKPKRNGKESDFDKAKDARAQKPTLPRVVETRTPDQGLEKKSDSQETLAEGMAKIIVVELLDKGKNAALPGAKASWRDDNGKMQIVSADDKGVILVDLRVRGNLVISGPQHHDKLFNANHFEDIKDNMAPFAIALKRNIPDKVIQASVRSAEGEVIEGLKIELRHTSRRYSESRERGLVQAFTDASGNITFSFYGMIDWDPSMSIVIRGLFGSFEAQPWMIQDIPKEAIDGAPITITLPEAVFIRGRVIDESGQAAARANVVITNYLMTHQRAYSSLWNARVTTSEDGTFVLPTRSVNLIAAHVEHHIRGEEERRVEQAEIEMVDARGKTVIDLGTAQTERLYPLKFRAIFEDKALGGALLEMRGTPSVIGGIKSQADGWAYSNGWTRSQLTGISTIPEVRFKTTNAISEWVPIREALLKGEQLQIVLEAMPMGKVRVVFDGDAPKRKDFWVKVRGSYKSHQVRFQNLQLDENDEIELAYGSYTLNFVASSDLCAPRAKITIAEGVTTEVRVRMRKWAFVRYRKPEVASDASLRIWFEFPERVSFSSPEEGDGEEKTVKLVPGDSLSLSITYMRHEIEKRALIPMRVLKPKENRFIDIEATLARLIAEAEAEGTKD